MDASVSPQLDSTLNDSVADGEENHNEASPSSVDPPQVSEADESPGGTVVQLPDGQTVQVQGVIQAPQTSVIQSPQVQTAQIATMAELEDDAPATDTQKRREILSRRPSYRKILNELSSDSPAVPKIDEEKTEEEAPVSSAASASVPTSIYQTSSGQYIAFAQGRAIQLSSPGAEALQGAQTLTVATSPTPQPGATILQCAAQPGDSQQQYYIQGGQVLIQGWLRRSSQVHIIVFSVWFVLSLGLEFPSALCMSGAPGYLEFSSSLLTCQIKACSL
ncbi:cAMP-responsive element modulator isoform X2 [Acanthopagrus latus]|uniref:cAMP-responsive element modulator isoform X2 n=1 Tax=Acanthopagrus latus TaxID=8177 RepID=UPI00187CA18F|nr:cAMP-responsive element modulator isoform X2 [Acanthopagrus latus]